MLFTSLSPRRELCHATNLSPLLANNMNGTRWSTFKVVTGLRVSMSQTTILRSSPAETRRLPDGSNARAVTSASCPPEVTSSVNASVPAAASHTLIVLSSDPLATHRPSALTAIVFNRRLWPIGLAVSPLDSSHTLTVLSTPADRIVCPFGANATELTQSACPRRARSSVLFDRSHTRTTRSPPPETMNRPSPLKATELTGLPCPLNSVSIELAPLSERFQYLTSPSPPQVASLVPSGP